MIKNISPGSGISVSGSQSTWPVFYYNGSFNNTLIGQVRYNGNSQTMEVYDGNVWHPLTSSYPTIELTGEVQAILNWAREKIHEENRVKELAAKHPSIADALEAVAHAEEQVRIVAALVETE